MDTTGMERAARLRVDLTEAGPDRSYDIVIGKGLLDQAGLLIRAAMAGRRAFVITDANVAPLYLDRLTAALSGTDARVSTHVLPPGEATKSFPTLEALLEDLVAAGADRAATLIALGGGVIGDLVGFAAAILNRGIAFIQVPTTLLSQVDSAVGGKTAVNLSLGKNLVGAFHQPRLVIADVDTLDTLPPRELRAGYAEVVKYGLIDDAPFFTWLEAHGPDLLDGDAQSRIHAVRTSLAAKARIVAADEREAGVRALLNLGHTFGHALEAATGFSERLLHGEGVAIGMVLAARLSAAMGLCGPEVEARLTAHLRATGLPHAVPGIQGSDLSAEALITHMARDKKVRDGRATFVLLEGIGRAVLRADVDPEALLRMLRAAQPA